MARIDEDPDDSDWLMDRIWNHLRPSNDDSDEPEDDESDDEELEEEDDSDDN